MNIALLQLHLLPGHVERNGCLIVKAVQGAVIASEEISGALPLLCVTPELALCGAPLETLPAAPGFAARCGKELSRLAEVLRCGPPVVIGTLDSFDGTLCSAAYLLAQGTARRLCARPLTEALHFGPLRGHNPRSMTRFDVHKRAVALWLGTPPLHLPNAEAETLVANAGKAALCLNMDAAPFAPQLWHNNHARVQTAARVLGRPVMRVNPAGGAGSWIFPGGSLSVDAQGCTRTVAKAFAQELLLESLANLQKDLQHEMRADSGENLHADSATPNASQPANHLMHLWQALVTGLGDYVRHSGLTAVTLGLSGGMDSSLVAAIAVEALGADKVTGLLMPSPWSSQGSVDDALALARNLGMTTHTVAISPLMDAFDTALAPIFGDRAKDVTEENIQARIRGCLLMALSNKFGAMLLSTTNKSETAVGYGTLYGDLAGGLAPIVDLYKTEVYALARWVNQHKGCEVIPQNVFDKPPSAELRPDQKDEDSLPPYESLDPFLQAELEGQDAETNLAPDMAAKIRRLLRCNEFKRHQCAQALFVSGCPLALRKRPLPAGD